MNTKPRPPPPPPPTKEGSTGNAGICGNAGNTAVNVVPGMPVVAEIIFLRYFNKGKLLIGIIRSFYGQINKAARSRRDLSGYGNSSSIINETI